MEFRTIGKSGIKVSAMSLGTWAIGGGLWWGDNDDAESIRTIHAALDGGINWVDTARVYGFGHSESVVGKAIKDRRHEVIVSTKCALQWYDGGGEHHFSKEGHEVHRDLSPKAIRRDLEMSLKELGTDYIDILYTHWQCHTYGLVPVEETMGELMRMKEEGKIRAIGASNVTLQHLKDYTAAGELDAIQEKYSMLDRRVEAELLPFCEEHGITLQTYSPIEQGLLAGKVPNDRVVKPGEARENKLWWKPENIRLANEMLAGWGDLTEKYGCSLANLAIRWTMMRSGSFNVLCGARKISQIAENIKSADVALSQEDFERMNQDALAAMAKAVR
ncbi:MAG: aldo/keto reductase [bacterium]|nr:aldo/keto reductase [bacterium]